ncbi:hypothetical protein D9Q98_005641 [Chlorella vulgaris]|uniref:Uncharacterized protein n=1 Tax=Chlorella vulgaris TaxID=3077 RepID=A0A9D4TMG4_CHLVU|nr:hypothetical protein D9Q98_005641 [Chlorella vulgaris]
MSHLKSSLRAPEGKWAVSSERPASTNFSADIAVHLTCACDEGCSPPQLLLCTIQHFLYITDARAINREPLRVVDLRQAGGGGVVAYPTCHAHTAESSDEFDVAVGLSTGEVVLLSLRAQLKAPASNTRPISSMCLNLDGCSGSAARCVSLDWVPGSAGTAFVAAHRDGTVLLYHKVVGSSSDTKLLARSSSSHALRPPVTQLQGPGGGGGGVSAAAVSPDGLHVAAACKDGVLRVYALPGGGLVGGCKSYYGGLLCCAWSPDGRYVAAGGEDDLLAVYGLQERCVVAYCQGHSSWVSGVAFDPWMCHSEGTEQEADGPEAPQEQQQQQQRQQAAAADSGASGALQGTADRVYRLASVGQDCQLALWDIVVSEDLVAAAQQASANNSPERERPGLPPSPGKRRLGGGGGGNGGSRSSSPLKRHGSGFASSFRSRAGGGSGADPGALPAALQAGIIAPPLPRADWPLVTPVVQARVHPEPACSVVFSAAAMFTACHGSCVRRWARPLLTQASLMQRVDSLQSLQSAEKPGGR